MYAGEDVYLHDLLIWLGWWVKCEDEITSIHIESAVVCCCVLDVDKSMTNHHIINYNIDDVTAMGSSHSYTGIYMFV